MTSVAPAGFSPRRGAAARAVSSPWTQIVRGDSEGLLASPSAATVASSVIEQLVVSAAPAVEDAPAETASDNANAGADKRLAWNKPSNVAPVAAAEVEPVMGADSWPPLSESTKAPAKSSTDSLKSFDGSLAPVPATQGTASSSLSSQKQANPPNMAPARQRSMKRNGSGNTSTNGGFSQPPTSQSPLVDMPPTNNSPRVTAQRSGIGSHPHNGNNNSQRSSYRNRSGGPQPRAYGSNHHNHGGRRDQDRGNQDWNAHRHFSGRNAHINQHRVVPRFAAPLQHPSSAAFMPPSPVRHFGSPIGFPELSTPVYFVATPPPESLRSGVPFVAPMPPHAVFLQPPDHQLHGKIVNQIHYYFSNENLIKDTYLRQNMDEQGWVPIKLLAGFKQVKLLTESIQLIADAVRGSTVVEVQGDKVRRRNDWMRWIMPPVFQFSNHANPQPAGTSSHDTLATSFQGLNVEEKASNNNSARGQADFNGEFDSQSNLSSTEGSSVPSRN